MYNELWMSMLARSWQPYQWYERDGESDGEYDNESEGLKMWVYRPSDNRSGWSVGYYAPDAQWVEDSEWDTQEEACARVRWLNGGGVDVTL